MRGFGEIARLCAVARPTVGVVTVGRRRPTPSASAASRAWPGPRPSWSRRCRRDGTADAQRRRRAGARRWPRAPTPPCCTFGESATADVRVERSRARRAGPAAFTLAHAVGDAPRSRSPSAARTWRSTPPRVAVAAAGLCGVDARRRRRRARRRRRCRRCGWRCTALRRRRDRDQRRLQRQPDVDARRARRPRRDRRPTGAVAVLGVMAELDDPAAAHRAIAEHAADARHRADRRRHRPLRHRAGRRRRSRRSVRSAPATPCSSRAAASPVCRRSPPASSPPADRPDDRAGVGGTACTVDRVSERVFERANRHHGAEGSLVHQRRPADRVAHRRVVHQ